MTAMSLHNTSMGKNNNENAFDSKLIAVYTKYGLDTFLDVCSKMLDIKDTSNVDKKKKSNGEVCEVVLRVLTEHYLKTKGIKGSVHHSMILNDLSNPRSDFLTELDFTVLTPYICLSGECKSFAGDLIIASECTLTRGELVADVARQSKLHGKCLKQYLERYTKANAGLSSPPFGLFCFVYSNGTITDNRTKKAQSTIPVLTIKTLYSYYDHIFGTYRRNIFEYEKAQAEFKRRTLSAELHEAHKRYLGY